MLDRIFNWGKKKEAPDPDIAFGRYSDNNKPSGKISRWTDADNFFREKKYVDSLDAFFEYLQDESIRNVMYQRNGAEGKFELYQGSKIVRGSFNDQRLLAEVSLARMPQPNVPVMRRLLEMNFSLYYSRFALDNDRLCMRFDSDMKGAAPSKLYYGLKELATKADKQDDLLVQDFSSLQKIDSEHITGLPLNEKEIKFEWLQKWIKQTLDAIAPVDAEKFSGGIFIYVAFVSLSNRLFIVPRREIAKRPGKNCRHLFQKGRKANHRKESRNDGRVREDTKQDQRGDFFLICFGQNTLLR